MSDQMRFLLVAGLMMILTAMLVLGWNTRQPEIRCAPGYTIWYVDSSPVCAEEIDSVVIPS